MNWFITGFVLVIAVEIFWKIITVDDSNDRNDYEDMIVPYLPEAFNTFNKRGRRK